MMIRLIERALLIILLIILAGIVVHAPLTVYLGTLFPDLSLVIKAWKEILMVLAGVLIGVVVYARRLWPLLIRDRLIWLIVIYVALHLITMLIFWHGWAATLAGLAIDLRFLGYFTLVYVLLQARPDWRNWFIKIAASGAIIVVGFGFLQLFLPIDILKHIGYDKHQTIAPYLTVDQNYDYVRINSTLRGPNPLGAYVTVVLACVAAAIVSGRLRLNRSRGLAMMAIFVFASMAVLWVSYSRSALVAASIAIAIVALIFYSRQINRYIWIGLAVISLSVGSGIYVARDSDFVSHVILHEDPVEGSSVSSNDGHAESLADGVQRLVSQPFGAGVGSTGSASMMTDEPVIIENHYLFVAHETGWLGLIVFLVIYGLVMLRLWHRRQDWLALGVFASGIGMAAIGMLLPVWVDDTVAIVWWGLAAVALTGKGVRNVQ